LELCGVVARRSHFHQNFFCLGIVEADQVFVARRFFRRTIMAAEIEAQFIGKRKNS
jgi:hypothetical protein